MRLADEVRIQLKGMNPVERESAVRELREVIYEDAYETCVLSSWGLRFVQCFSAV